MRLPTPRHLKGFSSTPGRMVNDTGTVDKGEGVGQPGKPAVLKPSLVQAVDTPAHLAHARRGAPRFPEAGHTRNPLPV